MSKLIALGWYGGKFSHLDWLLLDNDTAINVIKRYDSPETLFYCDPPYPHDSRGDNNAYRYEMTDDEHRELAEILHSVKGKVALSSYHCDLMDELYKDWQAVEGPTKLVHSVKQPRTEVLWVNYEISTLSKLKSGSKVEEWQALQRPLI
jgi:DNA adenine methylase